MDAATPSTAAVLANFVTLYMVEPLSLYGRKQAAFTLDSATGMPVTRDLLEEGVAYQRGGALDKALERFRLAAGGGEPAAVAEALRRTASIHRTRCAWDEALEAARRSGEVARRHGLADLEAEAINAEAAVQLSRGQLEQARALLLEILDITRDSRILGNAHQNLGTIAATLGDFAAAGRHYEESRTCFRSAGDDSCEAVALINQGRAAILQGGQARTAELCEEALAAARRVDDVELVALATLNLAESIGLRGDIAEAESMASAALGYFTIAGNEWRRIECLRLLGELAARRGDEQTALRCFDQGLAVAERVGAPVEERAIREAKKRLGR